MIYMKKFLHFDWLRAVQLLGNTVYFRRIKTLEQFTIQSVSEKVHS